MLRQGVAAGRPQPAATAISAAAMRLVSRRAASAATVVAYSIIIIDFNTWTWPLLGRGFASGQGHF